MPSFRVVNVFFSSKCFCITIFLFLLLTLKQKNKLMTAEVSLSFLEKSPNLKPDYGDERVTNMTGKSQFSDMAAHGIILADATTASANLRAGVLAADGGTDAQKDALKPLIKAWNKIFKKIANYVTEKANDVDDVDDQIDIINISGFSYNKVTRTDSDAPAQTTNFTITPAIGFSGKVNIKSDSLGRNVTYISIFHKDAAMLDAITIDNNQITFPPSTDSFIVHTTTDSRETEVNLPSGIKHFGTRYGVNNKGRGATSTKASVIPQ
jgi:hypothetical protein